MPPFTNNTDEFERLLKQREVLWNQTLRSLSNSVIVRGQILAPEPQASLQAYDMASLMDQAQNPYGALEQQSLRQMRDQDDLIGAARFYGIRNAERIPVDELEEMVAQKRNTLQDFASQQEISLSRALYNGVATAIGQVLTTPGQQTLRILGNIAERLPFMGDTISRSETMREADRWFNMVQEGLTADLPEGRRQLSRGVSGAVGMFPAAIWSWQAMGALGAAPGFARVGAKMTPLGRAAVRGFMSEMLIQDPTAPLHEQAVNGALGAAFGGAEALGGLTGAITAGAGVGAMAGAIADDSDPRTMILSAALGAATFGLGHGMLNKVRRSFPSSALDADFQQPRLGPGPQPLDADFIPVGERPPTVDADWVGENLMRLGGDAAQTPQGEGWQPAGLLPSPRAMEGTLDPQTRITRGQPWLTEESSLQDADFSIIESLGGAPRLGEAAPQGLLPTNRGLPPGQYEVYGVGGAPVSTPTEGPSVWMQTPPEVRGFVRRVVGERRAARRAAETDPMTGAGNRAAWSRAQLTAESDPSISVVALDVNNLKAANDLIGHEFGDEMILNASRAAQQAAQQTGIANRLFRLGGDEFVALVPTERVQQYLETVQQTYGGHDAGGYTVSISGGVGNTLEEADRALRAMKAGRNGTAYRNLGPQDAAEEAAQLTKQSSIIESPIVADVAGVPKLDDADAAWAVVESFPGQVGIVQNVGDVATTVRRILMDQMPNGVGPQDFRVVQRPIPPHIRGVAVQLRSGRVIETPAGTTHDVAIDRAIEQGILRPPTLDPDTHAFTNYLEEQIDFDTGYGFVTNTGQYLSRDEALAFARAQFSPEAQASFGADLARRRGWDRTPSMEADARWLSIFEEQPRTDILVSSGRPITNKMVKEYENYGMFSGQRARIGTGQEVVIESLNGDLAKVRPVYGGPILDVPVNELLPMKSSAIIDDLPGFYEGFQTYASIRLDQQAREAGMSFVPGIYDQEIASQIPLLMDEYIKANNAQSYYAGALRQLLEQRHIEALRNLAPPEELGMLREVQTALQVLQQETGALVQSSVDDLASARGMTLQRHPSGIDLVDDVTKGEVRVPLEDEGAVRAFLHDFQREPIDDSPVTPFPLEAIETPPGYSETIGDTPGEFRTADQWGDAAEEMIANWFALGGEDMLRGMMHPDLGGGGGAGIPPGGASGTFGGWDPMRELPPVRDVYQQTAEQWRRAHKNDPRRLKIIAGELDNIIARLFVPMRNLLERAQQHARSLGVSTADYLTSMRDLDTQYNRVINDAHPWEERLYEALNPVRNRLWRDGTVWEILNAPLHHQEHLMRVAKLKPEEREAIRRVKEIFDDFHENVARQVYPGIGYRENYVTWYRQFEEQLPGDPFRRPMKAEWGPENPRGSDEGSLEKNMGAIIPRYFRSFYKAQYMQQPYQHMKRMVRDEAVPEVIREAVDMYAETRMWGLDPTKDWMVKGLHWALNKVGNRFGQTFTTQDVMKMYLTGFNAEYRSSLGGRVDPLIRDLPQLFTGAAQVGLDRGIPLLKRMLSDKEYLARANRLAREAGWIQEGGGGSIDPDVFGSTAPNSTNLREGLARIGDFVQDRMLRPLALRHGIQGSWLDWLAPYGKLGDFARVHNAMLGYESAMDALRKYTAAQNERGTWAVPLEDLQRQLLKDSRVSRFQGGIQQSFLDYVNRGDYEGAARFFGGEVATNQNLYGMAQQPRAWQSWGPIAGKKAMQWLTFNSQTLANMAHVLRDKHIDFPDKAAYVAQVGTMQAMMAGAQLLTGWNFSRMSLLGAGFGFAGSGIFDITNKIQKVQAWWEQFDPAGTPLTPDQRALMGSPGSSYESPFDPRYSALNPWAGGLRTAEGLSESIQWGPEATARFLTTGQRGDPFQERLRRDMVEFETMPRDQVDAILRTGPEAPDTITPGLGAMY